MTGEWLPADDELKLEAGYLSIFRAAEDVRRWWTPFGLVSTSGGFLIVSNFSKHDLTVFNARTGCVVEELYHKELMWALGMALSDRDRMVYVACRDSHRIISVEIPDQFFTPISAVSTGPIERSG